MLNPRDRLKVLRVFLNEGSGESESGLGIVDRSRFSEDQLEYVEILCRSGMVQKEQESASPGVKGYSMVARASMFLCELFSEGGLVRSLYNSDVLDILVEHGVICRETPFHLEWIPIEKLP